MSSESPFAHSQRISEEKQPQAVGRELRITRQRSQPNGDTQLLGKRLQEAKQSWKRERPQSCGALRKPGGQTDPGRRACIRRATSSRPERTALNHATTPVLSPTKALFPKSHGFASTPEDGSACDPAVTRPRQEAEDERLVCLNMPGQLLQKMCSSVACTTWNTK